jgi:hypothetical protein
VTPQERQEPVERAQLVQVDEGLESLIVGVESAVVTYLVRIDDASQAALLGAVQALDADVEASEAFQRRKNAFTSVTGVSGLGRTSLAVIGQKSEFPTVNELPVRVFQAQIALVRAAKEELRAASPSTLDALDLANNELATARSRHFS